MADIAQVKHLLECWTSLKLTADVKKQIKELANEVGVEVRTGTSCRNCWHDALIEIYTRLKKQADAPERPLPQNTQLRYVYKVDHPVTVMRYGVFAADTPVELIEKLHQQLPGMFNALYKIEWSEVTTEGHNDENNNDTSSAHAGAEGGTDH